MWIIGGRKGHKEKEQNLCLVCIILGSALQQHCPEKPKMGVKNDPKNPNNPNPPLWAWPHDSGPVQSQNFWPFQDWCWKRCQKLGSCSVLNWNLSTKKLKIHGCIPISLSFLLKNPTNKIKGSSERLWAEERKLNSGSAAQADEIFGRESQMSAKTHWLSPSEKAIFPLFYYYFFF